MDAITNVIAKPSKEFFVSMITRDILLKEAIIELIDNCLDGARKTRKSEDFRELFIKVKFNKDSFQIEDNCGGIDLNTAIHYAFCFGRPKNAPISDTEVAGFFGIGMKRALFKIGRFFEIESTTENSKFNLKVDVDTWTLDENEDWNFPIDSYDNERHAADKVGTKITVTKLFEGVSLEFNSTPFLNELIQHVTRRIGLEIENGLNITINDVPITPIQIEILNNDSIKPIKESFTENDVTIDIIAGISKNREPKGAGWYIYCNKRLIVAADKTSLTTWKDAENEDGIVVYHNDFAAFRGFVFFNSKTPDKLPWNTTKTGIDPSSPIYLFTRSKMFNLFRIIQPTIKKIYGSGADSEEDNIEELLTDMPSVQVNALTAKTQIHNNTQIRIENLIKVNTNPNITISYKRPKKEVEKVKKILKVTSNKDVGVKTFEYFLDAECDLDAR